MSDIGPSTLGGAINTGAFNKDYNSAALQSLDKDAFLELLVAQMRYQNPLGPADSNEFLAQAAQYASVEQLENMSQRQAELRSMQMITVATGLVGKEVTGISELTGEQITGIVSTVRFGEEPVIVIDGADIPLSMVTQVDSAGPANGVRAPEASPATSAPATTIGQEHAGAEPEPAPTTPPDDTAQASSTATEPTPTMPVPVASPDDVPPSTEAAAMSDARTSYQQSQSLE